MLPTSVDLQSLLPEEAFVAAISVAELWIGTYRADTSERRRYRESYIGRVTTQCSVIDFRQEEARQMGRLWAELSGAGQMIGERDLQIAATALANGHEVLTANAREFRRVPGLHVRESTI
jgi:tRNA(fMet)-specific endonuclease VapC